MNKLPMAIGAIFSLLLATIAPAQSDISYFTNRTRANFDSLFASEIANNRALHDIEIEEIGGNERFCSVYAPTPSGATFHYLIQESPSVWSTWLNEKLALNGRLIDIEVDYFDGNKLYSAIFFEDGDKYAQAVRTTNTNDQFEDWLVQYQEDGLQIVDFEAYHRNGITYYAGVWANAPNQPVTSLFYGLQVSELSDLLRPLEGRILDFERYYSEEHDEHRYAIIVAMVPGTEWALWRNQTSSELLDRHNAIADADTRLIDVEMWDDEGSAKLAGLWGENFGALREVPAIPNDPSPRPIHDELQTWINRFEQDTTDVSGTLGFYARNLMTGDSIAYREDEMFYLASCAKVLAHVRLWQEIQAGNVLLTDTLNYTNGPNTLEPWFVDQRPLPGMSPCLCNPNFCTSGRTPDTGQAITVDRLDRAMMQVSDNAATTMIIDNDQWGLATRANPSLNEWLATIDGTSRGLGIINSIQKLDAIIAWQGQVFRFPEDDSYLQIPRHLMEQRSRYGTGVNACTDVDNDGTHDLAEWTVNNSIPRTSFSTGFERYYAMNMNSSTPRAFVNFLQKFWEGEFLDDVNTRNALQVMQVGASGSPLGTPLDNALSAEVADEVTVYAKGGSKGGASNPKVEVGYYEIGGDVIALMIATKNNVNDPTPAPGEDGDEDITRVYIPGVGHEILRALTPDLETFGEVNDDYGVEIGLIDPQTAEIGATVDIAFPVENKGLADSPPFAVNVYASLNASFTPSVDPFLGQISVSALDAGDARIIRQTFTVPNIGEGTYNIFWEIDEPANGEPSHGSVSEYDEDNNQGYLLSAKLTVVEPPIPPGLMIY